VGLPQVADQTLRFGTSFTYSVPAWHDWPYIVALHFLEPCAPGVCSAGSVTAAGQRIFSVTINRQVIFPALDVFTSAGGSLLPFVWRTIVIPGDDDVIVITLTASQRTAILSAIDFRPLFTVQ